jgi:hypothetical protein
MTAPAQRGQQPDLYEKAGEGRELSGLEIIAKLATVLDVEPAELLKMPASKLVRER